MAIPPDLRLHRIEDILLEFFIRASYCKKICLNQHFHFSPFAGRFVISSYYRQVKQLAILYLTFISGLQTLFLKTKTYR